MANALITYYTNRRRSLAANGNTASSDEIDGAVHGEQDLDGMVLF